MAKVFWCPFFVFLCVACGTSRPLGVSTGAPLDANLPSDPAISTPAPSTVPVVDSSPFPTPSLPPEQSVEIINRPAAPNTPPLVPFATLQGTPAVSVDQNGNPATGTRLFPLALTVIDPNAKGGFNITIVKSDPEGVSCSTMGTSLSCLFPRPGAYSLFLTVVSLNALSILKISGVNVIAVAVNPFQGTYDGSCTTHYKNAPPGKAVAQLRVATDGSATMSPNLAGLPDDDFSGTATPEDVKLEATDSAGRPGGLWLHLGFTLEGGVPTKASGSGAGVLDPNYFYECSLQHTKLVFP